MKNGPRTLYNEFTDDAAEFHVYGSKIEPSPLSASAFAIWCHRSQQQTYPTNVKFTFTPKRRARRAAKASQDLAVNVNAATHYIQYIECIEC